MANKRTLGDEYEQRAAIEPLIPMNRRDVTSVGTGRRATGE
jgi:hypothetical protein